MGLLLCKFTAVVTASAQKLIGMFALNIIGLADSKSVRLSLSGTPFRTGEYELVY